MRKVWLCLGAVTVAGAAALAAAGEAAPPRDRKPPTTPTVDGDRPSFDLRPVFHFGATDDRSTRAQLRFRCSIDSATLRPCARIYRAPSALTFAPHLLRVRAVDRAGNQSRIALFAFTVIGTWDAARDFEKAPRPANPSRDKYGNTAWFYLYSGTTAHDPSDYHLLTVFAVLDPNSQVWRSTAAEWPSGTAVGFTGSPSRISIGPVGHYNLGQNAVLGWRSPVNSTVTVQVGLTHSGATCNVPAPPEDGINSSIDRGAETIRSGHLAKGATTDLALTTSVNSGDTLYLVINAGADTNCDGAMVDMRIETPTQ